jgi:hypothetical protein
MILKWSVKEVCWEGVNAIDLAEGRQLVADSCDAQCWKPHGQLSGKDHSVVLSAVASTLLCAAFFLSYTTYAKLFASTHFTKNLVSKIADADEVSGPFPLPPPPSLHTHSCTAPVSDASQPSHCSPSLNELLPVPEHEAGQSTSRCP